MPENSQPQNSFERLPFGIQQLLTSPQTVDAITEINDSRVSPENDGVIPRLLLRLMLKKIYPQNFIAELRSNLNVDGETARLIARDLVKSILGPAKETIKRELEIDIGLIELGGEEAIPDAALSPAIIAPEVANLPKFAPETKIPTTPIAEITPTPTIYDGESPLIIHEEKSPIVAGAEPVVPSFNYKPKEESYWRSAEPKPIAVRVETPKNALANPEPKNPRRIVHYSNFRTPLNDANDKK